MHFHCRGPGSIPGRGTKSLKDVARPKQSTHFKYSHILRYWRYFYIWICRAGDTIQPVTLSCSSKLPRSERSPSNYPGCAVFVSGSSRQAASGLSCEGPGCFTDVQFPRLGCPPPGEEHSSSQLTSSQAARQPGGEGGSPCSLSEAHTKPSSQGTSGEAQAQAVFPAVTDHPLWTEQWLLLFLPSCLLAFVSSAVTLVDPA